MENKPSIKPYIVIGALAIIIVGGIIWYFSRQTKKTVKETGVSISGTKSGFPQNATTPTTPENVAGQTEKELAGAPEPKLVQITDFAVVSPTLNKKGDKILFYAKSDGDIYESDFLGKEKKKISNITVLGILEAQWSPQKDRAIIWYLDKNEVKKFIQTISTSTKATFLPPSVYTASWSQDGSSVAYLTLDKDGSTLALGDSSAKNPKIKFKTPVRDFRINWTSQNQISFNSASSGFAPSVLYLFNTKDNSFSKIIDNIYGFIPLWSPDGEKLLYSASNINGENLSLHIKKIKGDVSRLPIQTLPEKCAWSQDSKEIFCALPKDFQNTNMPDSYYQGLTYFSDRFVKIEAENSEITEFFNEQNFDAENILITKDKQKLFFVNRKDGTLWGINLGTRD